MDKTHRTETEDNPNPFANDAARRSASTEKQGVDHHVSNGQMANPGPGTEEAPENLSAGGLASGTVGHESLAAELDAIRSQLRDYEKALVERIADVDDDRRGTANRLQRAWQTQREEMDQRLRRQGGLLAGALGLFAVLVVAAMFLAYREMDADRQPLADGLAEVKAELARFSRLPSADALMEEKLVQLAAAVGGISSSLERLNAEPGSDLEATLARERAARNQAVARFLGEVRRLEEAQAALEAEMRSLRSEVSRAQATRAESLRAAPVDVAPASGVNDAAVAAPLAAPDAPTEPENEQSTTDKATASAPAPSPEATPITPLTPAPAASASASELPATPQELPPSPEEAQAAKQAQLPSGVAPTEGEPVAVDAGPEERVAPGQAEAPGADDTGEVEPGPRPGLREVIVVGDSQYAVQLLGVYSLQSLLDYVATADLPARVYYREETFRGRPWYVLIHSLHDSYDDASEEQTRLPPELAKLDIWIRTLPEGSQLQVLDTRSPM